MEHQYNRIKAASETKPPTHKSPRIPAAPAKRPSLGRSFHRQLPAIAGQPSTLQPTLRLDPSPPALLRRCTQAAAPNSNERHIVTSSTGHALSGYHFNHLLGNKVIHNHVIDDYLQLLQPRYSGKYLFCSINIMDQLRSGEQYTRIDRVFRRCGLLTHDQIFFPVYKAHHFMLLTARPRVQGRNIITLYDSLTYDSTEEIDALLRYLQHVATTTNNPELLH